MFGVLYEKSCQCYKAKRQAVPRFLAATALLFMLFALASPSFATMPQAAHVADMQQDMIQDITTDFITQFETIPFLMSRAAPVAQVAFVAQAAPAAQIAPAPQTQLVSKTLASETLVSKTQKRIYQFFHALFDLLHLPKTTPAPIKPDTALGVRG